MASDVRDALDASVQFGSGYVCVMGPPSCGKTTCVLQYLTAREEQFHALNAAETRVAAESWGVAKGALSGASPSPARVFQMAYLSARATHHDTLRRFMEHMMHDGKRRHKRRRVQSDCTALEFGATVTHWLHHHSPGSELHLVLDDADTLEEGADAVDGWLSNCDLSDSPEGSGAFIWLISQVPLRVANCFRYHFIPSPDVQTVCQWLAAQYEVHGEALLRDGPPAEADTPVLLLDEGPESISAVSTETASLTPAEAHQCACEAIRYYRTHLPMRASIVSKDLRQLLHRVYQLLPALVALAGPVSGAHVARRLNAVHYATVWGRHSELAAAAGEDTALHSTSASPLVSALKRMGLSAVLLAFAAFYGGAVPEMKQYQVFGSESGGAAPRTSDAHGQSHRAAVLSASTHLVSTSRLLFLYESMLRMCVHHIDPLEFAVPEVAVHFVHGFLSWGLLTPAQSQRGRSYRCWIPVSVAIQLGRELSLNLFDLIPS